ncbi:MAG: putative nucleic-acid-binding protein containing a Zn-ribbon domain protein [halophilic archaeon J07HX64]|jgi:Predicted nucleic-acid-binding protein containing a Zn-ribbon domain|nr:MAG: putative nucleic-acid-binding protein containing a Zn-ribbon domain protein [halophilic archaeon J07HX64]
MSRSTDTHDNDSRGCPKCEHEQTEVDEISTTGSGLSKYFDVQNRSFTVVSCTNCGYSELYRNQSSGNAIDVFLG